MRHGVDTNFLVAVETKDHVHHQPARALLERLISVGDSLIVAPLVLGEFIHVVTDQRRLVNPLSMEGALRRARFWWDGKEVERVYPCKESVTLFLEWMESYRLGRKRILDTQLASTLRVCGVTSLITNNQSDFRVFGGFNFIGFRDEE